MKISKDYLQEFFERSVEPWINDYISEEVVVTYENKRENVFYVDVVSKVLQVNSLFEENIDEVLFHKAPLWKFGHVKTREPFYIKQECRYMGHKFYLLYRITKEKTGETQ